MSKGWQKDKGRVCSLFSVISGSLRHSILSTSVGDTRQVSKMQSLKVGLACCRRKVFLQSRQLKLKAGFAERKDKELCRLFYRSGERTSVMLPQTDQQTLQLHVSSKLMHTGGSAQAETNAA